MNTTCPDKNRLESFSRGMLGEEDSDHLMVHLQDCQSCQQNLETIDGVGEDTFIRELRGASSDSGNDAILAEPEFRSATAKALAALAKMDEFDAEISLPHTIGEYEIVKSIGRGGMGRVFLGRHTKLGRQVAVKVLAQHRRWDQRMHDRFEAEMRAIGGLNHPNIVVAHDARDVDGVAVLVTEYVEGLDGSDLLKRKGRLSIPNACRIAAELCKALDYIAEKKLIHRDVKPSNVMIDDSGNVKLLDLGLARIQTVDGENEFTATGQAMGTADYVAPEQINDARNVDARADLYGLGCTLYKMLAGRAPFSGDEFATTYAKMNAHVSQTPDRLSQFREDVPRELESLIHRMLEKKPADRPGSAKEVQTILEKFASGSELGTLIKEARTLPRLQQRFEKPNKGVVETKETLQPQSSFWNRIPWWAALASVLAAFGAGMLMQIAVTVEKQDGTKANVVIPDGSTAVVDAEGNITIKLAGGGEGVIMSENVEVHKTNDQTDSSAGQEVEVVPHDDKNILKSDRYHLQGAWRGRLPNDVPFSLAFVNDRVVFFGPDGYQKAASFDLETTGKPRTGMLRVIDSNGITALRLNWDRSEYWLLEENDQLRPELLQVASNSFKGAFTYLTRVKQPHNEVELAAVKFLEKLNNEPIRLSFHTANPFATEKTELEDLKYDEQPFITNRDFVSIRVTENRHGHSLNVTLNELAGEKMRYYTKQHVGSKLVVKFDGKVVTAPRINSEIGTRITIEGDFTEEQLREIATDLVPMSRIDRRTQSEDNLRTLGLGLHNYESVFQKLPAANHRGKDWKHSFSWRVAILPYIDQKKLYQQFRFNEPWDSEHNLEVAKEMPDAFRLPGDDPESFHTHYLAVSGKRTILGTDKPIGLAQVVDGTSCTLMVIQDERKVVWTQPEDFEVTDESIQELASRSDPNFTFLVGDGSVHTIRRNKIDVDELKNLLLRDDGNVVDYEMLSGPESPFDDPGDFVDSVEPIQEGLPLDVPQLFEKVKPPMKMLDGPVQDRRR